MVMIQPLLAWFDNIVQFNMASKSKCQKRMFPVPLFKNAESIMIIASILVAFQFVVFNMFICTNELQ